MLQGKYSSSILKTTTYQPQIYSTRGELAQVLQTHTKNTLPGLGYFTVARHSYGFYIEGNDHEIDFNTIDDFEGSWRLD
jgi:hypothetical protein